MSGCTASNAWPESGNRNKEQTYSPFNWCHKSVRFANQWLLSCVVTELIAGLQSAAHTLTPVPVFRVEPPPHVVFSNKYGTVIPCQIDAYPGHSVRIAWLATIGDTYVEVENVLGLRLVRDDGSLCFPPFNDTQYNDNIHNNGYICVGHTSYGTIGSREVRVRAGKSFHWLAFQTPQNLTLKVLTE